MSGEIYVEDLKAQALDYADLTGSTIIVQQRLTGWLQSGLSQLWEILRNSYADWIHKTATWTQSANEEDKSLPSDFLQVNKLFIVDNGRRYGLKMWGLDEIDGYHEGPLCDADLELWYIPQCPRLGDDKDLVPIWIPVGWTDFVALHAACMSALKSEANTLGALQAEREAARVRIIEGASPRTIAETFVVQDVNQRFEDNGRETLGLVVDRDLKYRILGQTLKFVEIDYRGV